MATSPDVTVRLVADLADLEAALALRHEVFVVGQAVPVEHERDAYDGVAVHVLAVAADGAAVATGRLIPRGDIGGVGRMAVREAQRGAGVGAAILRRLEAAALDAGYPAIELHAQDHAVGFYRRAGYAPSGPAFLEAGIEHLPMRKALPVVRDGRDEDGPALAAIIAGCFAEYPGCVLDIDREEPWLRAPASSYAGKGGHLWTVELAGEVVACGAWRPSPAAPDTVELKSLYVAPPARRRGLAAHLTGRVEAAARAAGAREVELWSDTRFSAAHQLYLGLGYEQLPDTRDLHDLSNTTEYHFRKVLR